MKKLFTILSIASLAVLFAGCNKEGVSNSTEEQQPFTIKVTVDDDTKVSLDGATVTWAVNDKIYVVSPGNGSENTYWAMNEFKIVNSGDISVDGKTATFTDQSGKDWTNATYIAAFYGRTGSGGKTYPGWHASGTVGSGSCYVDNYIPSVQTYRDGGPNPLCLFMATSSVPIAQAHSLSFKNVVSILKIPVIDTTTPAGDKVTLKSIKVKCGNSADDRAIGGRWYGWLAQGGTAVTQFSGFSYSSFNTVYDNIPLAAGGSGTKSDEEGGSYGDNITLTSINKKLSDDPQYFYIVCERGAHGTMTFTLTDSEDNTKTFIYNKSFTSAWNSIYTFPVLDWASK